MTWRTWVLGGALLFAAWLTYIVFASGRADVLAEAVLPDGTILRLNAVTFGSEQKFFVQQPRPPYSWLGVGEHEISASMNLGETFHRNGIWLTRRDPETGESLDLNWFSHCVAVDTGGWEHVSGFAGRCHWTTTTPVSPFQNSLVRDPTPLKPLPAGKYREIVVGAFLPMFRPENSRFPLRVYNTAGEVVAEFDAPYPGTPPIDENWTPQPLPATQASGDLEVTLERIDWTPQPADVSVADNRLPTLNVQPQVSLNWHGQSSEDWKLITENIMAVEDGLGNYSYMERCRLTPNVRAWKLGLLLLRKPDGRYEPHEEWNLGPIELPDANESVAFDLTSQIGDIPVQLVRVCGAGSTQFTLRVMNANSPRYAIPQTEKGWTIDVKFRRGFADWTVDSERPLVVWQLQNTTPGGRNFLTRIFDSDGNQLPAEHIEAMYSTDGQRTCFAFFEPPGDAGPVTVLPTIHEGRSVSFLIEPPHEELAKAE